MKLAAAVILAAGASSRMGSPKQLLKYNDDTLLRHIIRQSQKVFGERVVVVLGSEADAIEASIKELNCSISYNHEWETGMSSSIRTGMNYMLSKIPGITALVFITSDQPFVDSDHLSAILNTYLHTDNQVVASLYDGVAGIPALFDQSLFPALHSITGDTGARFVIKTFEGPMSCVAFQAGSIDIDTPAQYKALQKDNDPDKD